MPMLIGVDRFMYNLCFGYYGSFGCVDCLVKRATMTRLFNIDTIVEPPLSDIYTYVDIVLADVGVLVEQPDL